MKKNFLLSIFCLWTAVYAFGQGATTSTFQVRYKIYLNGNPNFPIMYSPGKTTKEEVIQKVYDTHGQVVNEVKSVSKDWLPAAKFDFSQYPALKNAKFLYADVVQSDDKSQLIIYFCPFNGNTAQANTTAAALPAPNPYSSAGYSNFDQKVADGNFYIDLKSREVLNIKTGAKQAGPLTLPFKVYLTSRDTGRAGNVVTAVNLSGYYGWKWGHTGFVNLPAEKAGKMHQTFFSLNLIGGLSKVDVDASTNINGSAKKGSAVAISPGAGAGFHYDSFALFAVLGTDLPLGRIAGDWRYKNQLWLGFGVGFSIL